MGEHISSLSCQSHSSRARRVQQSKGIKSSYKLAQEVKSHTGFRPASYAWCFLYVCSIQVHRGTA
jgi:hypothetical protein